MAEQPECAWQRLLRERRFQNARRVIAANHTPADDVIIWACKNGALDVVEWTVAEFPWIMEAMEMFDGGDGLESWHFRALEMACTNGHLPTVQWMTAKFRMSSVADQCTPAFQCACAEGHLHIAEWLHGPFRLRGYLDEDDYLWAIRPAICNKHRNVVEWLASEPQMGKAAVQTLLIDEWSAWLEPKHFHADFATWLVGALDLTSASKFTAAFHSPCRLAFDEACAHNRLDIMVWLAATFNMTAEHIEYWCGYGMGMAQVHGYQEVLNWIFNTFARNRMAPV